MKLQLFLGSAHSVHVGIRASLSGKTNQLEPLRPLRTKTFDIYIYTYICFLLVWVTKMMRDWSDSPMNQSEEFVEEFCVFSQPLKPPKQFTLITLTAEVKQFPRYWRIRKPTEKKDHHLINWGFSKIMVPPKMTMNQIKKPYLTSGLNKEALRLFCKAPNYIVECNRTRVFVVTVHSVR